MLAANVVYDPEVWDALVKTVKALSGSSTLLLIADQRRPKLDAGPFYKALSGKFEMKLLAQSLLHVAFRRQGVFSCRIHVLRQRESKWKRKTDDQTSSCTEKKKESAAAKDEKKDLGAVVAWRQTKGATQAITAAAVVEEELKSWEAKKRRKGIKLALAAAVRAQAALAALPQYCL